MDGNSTEAERWLTIAEKLLASRDFHGTRTFAIRVRESAPVLGDQILAVTDTLLTVQANPHDWYGILQLVPLTQSMEVVASQYRKLAILLNPSENTLPFADQAFRFVSDAWNVLSNPSKKLIYDNELRFLQFGQVSQFNQLGQLGQQHYQQQPELQQPQTQMLFMQPQPPPPKETQTLFMQTPQKETQKQVTQSLFVRSPRSNSKDGNTELERGGQLGLNNTVPESTRPGESAWTRQIYQLGLAEPNQTGSVSSSHISWPENTRTSQINRPEPIRASQVNQSGTSSSSHFNLTEPTRTSQVNHTSSSPPPPPAAAAATTTTTTEHSRAEPADVSQKTDSTRPNQASGSERLTFWTACPYCYVLYEYPKAYEDYTLRCQMKECRRAFHAVVIPSPPLNGKDTYFCCWGFYPLGFSGNGKNMDGNFPCWSPISPMFTCSNNKNAGKEKNSKKSAPRVFYDDHDVYVEISDSSMNSEGDDE
ncbi:Chaperone DnaJ-domain superfamily protein, putative isoform 1 [Hibiscus syriacus]|uniref:Chaperone DnaJ-domain superfamily protein, putative isoform 1 n=1 Tax=Hibiscus syriacus TaxID=106335 RepID=A0A6A2XW80_HIBSY|nr:uncharacterized protein LOC120160190 [Hibiscus syriacus]KAE8679993.1 Chaperone DnaJ-domain superfamily protein, putative isoform 1 [Hibiscus syriacus]